MHAPRFRVLAALAVLLVMVMRVEAQATYDVLLRGGHVIDPRNGIDAVMDVAVAGGKIAAVRAGIDPGTAKQGRRRRRPLCHAGADRPPCPRLRHDRCPRRLGGGQQRPARRLQLPDRRHDDGGRRKLRVAQLRGLPAHRDRPRQHTCPRHAQYRRLRHADRRAGAEHPRHGREGHRGHGPVGTATSWSASSRPITRAPSGCPWTAPWKRVATAGVPVMVDFGYFREERPYYKLVGEHLRPGDISTHMFRGPVPYWMPMARCSTT